MPYVGVMPTLHSSSSLTASVGLTRQERSERDRDVGLSKILPLIDEQASRKRANQFMPHVINSAAIEGHETRVCLAIFLESLPFKIFMGTVVLCNMVLVIRETDLRANEEEPTTAMVLLSYVMLGVYIIDLVTRIYVECEVFIESITNTFDAIIVFVDILLAVLTQVFGPMRLPSVTFLRGLRMLKIIRVLRGFMLFRELYLMVAGLISAIRAIVFGFGLIMVTLTMWSIIAVDTLHATNADVWDGKTNECPRCQNAFQSVMASNLTFMKQILAGDSWGQLSLPLIEANPWTSVVIFGVFLSLELGLVNVIAAVMVDGQAQARAADEQLLHAVRKEKLAASYSRLRNLFASMDEDGSGSLTLPEMLDSYDKSDQFREILELMDIGREDMALVFEIMDVDGSGDVSYQEFVEQLHRIRTTSNQTLLVFMSHHIMRMRKSIDRVDRTLSEMHDHHKRAKAIEPWRGQSDSTAYTSFPTLAGSSPSTACLKPSDTQNMSQTQTNGPAVPRSVVGSSELRIELERITRQLDEAVQSELQNTVDRLKAVTERMPENGKPVVSPVDPQAQPTSEVVDNVGVAPDLLPRPPNPMSKKHTTRRADLADIPGQIVEDATSVAWGGDPRLH